MLRTLFSPRLLGMHAVAILVLISFILLGRWQLGVWEDSGRPHASIDPPAVSVTGLSVVGAQLTGPSVGRRVTAEGEYDAARQLLVTDRHPDVAAPGGRAARDAGFWVVTPLRFADGTMIPIVRGWTATAGSPAVAVPQGRVTVTGRLRPPEGSESVQRRPEGVGEGRIQSVSTAELINLWQGQKLRNGFVVAQDAPAGLTPVKVAPPQQGGELTWRNLAYAANWWIFAGFAVFMWFHFVRDAVRGGREPGTSPELVLES
jgi:cytochrome oxidase assembly protein ShyY1